MFGVGARTDADPSADAWGVPAADFQNVIVRSGDSRTGQPVGQVTWTLIVLRIHPTRAEYRLSEPDPGTPHSAPLTQAQRAPVASVNRMTRACSPWNRA